MAGPVGAGGSNGDIGPGEIGTTDGESDIDKEHLVGFPGIAAGGWGRMAVPDRRSPNPVLESGSPGGVAPPAGRLLIPVFLR